jgi:hypothetical protein
MQNIQAQLEVFVFNLRISHLLVLLRASSSSSSSSSSPPLSPSAAVSGAGTVR